MPKNLIIAAITFLLVLIVSVLCLVRKRNISIKYSLIWLFPSIILVIFTLIPGVMTGITAFLGFQTPSNMILTILISFSLVINLALTVIVTNQKDKIRLLVQEISIIKAEMPKK